MIYLGIFCLKTLLILTLFLFISIQIYGKKRAKQQLINIIYHHQKINTNIQCKMYFEINKWHFNYFADMFMRKCVLIFFQIKRFRKLTSPYPFKFLKYGY